MSYYYGPGDQSRQPGHGMDRPAGRGADDNACRHAGPDGAVRIGVRAHGSRTSLTAEDSGPGIAETDRPRLFDRFHRATEQGSGTGLGLAIGDSTVRSTDGRLHIGDSPLGGALMMVTWKRHITPHRLTGQRITTGGPGVSAVPGPGQPAVPRRPPVTHDDPAGLYQDQQR